MKFETLKVKNSALYDAIVLKQKGEELKE